MMASPSDSSTKLAIAKATPISVTKRNSMTLASDVPNPERALRALQRIPLVLRRVLFVLVRVREKVAHLHRVGGVDIRETLHDLESLLVIYLREMNGEKERMTLWVKPVHTLPRIERESTLRP